MVEWVASRQDRFPNPTPPIPAIPPLTLPPIPGNVEHMFATEPQTQTEEQPPTLAEIVREVTDNGRTIINFLQDAMDGKLDGFEPCHRIAAARELAKRGDKKAIAFLQSFYPKPNGRKSNGRQPAPAIGEYLSDDELAPNHELAEIVREVTDNGRTIVRFLHDAMQGILDGFKPCHRVACAKELLHRGFDITHAYSGDDDQDRDDDPISQERLENRTRHNAKQYNDDGDPFDFDNYDREDYIRDRMGHRAELHIFGGEEALEVALHTAREFGRESRAAGHIGDYDYSPIENPEDDPYGKGCYGYNVLRIAFQNNNAIRAINKAVAEYHKRKFKHFINEDGSLAAPADTASLDPRALQYLERSRHLLVEDDEKPPQDPDPPSSITPERAHDPDPPSSMTPEHAHDPPVGAGFKPARGLTHPPAEGPPTPTPPPKKKPPKTHLGPTDKDPPDDNPRDRRDPGEIRIPLRNLLSITAGPL